MKKLARDRSVMTRAETTAVLLLLITYAATFAAASLAITLLCRPWGG
jgi:hypothetical protein